MRIAVASMNPVKLAAARQGFEQAFPDLVVNIHGNALVTDVPDQPIGDKQTYQGALARVNALHTQTPNADYWVGIEGGVQRTIDGSYDSFAWIIVQQGEQRSSSRTSTFPLPPRVCQYLDEGLELGDADDLVFGRSQSKQQNGAVGLLTADKITRTDLLSQSVFLALIPFQFPNLYAQE